MFDVVYACTAAIPHVKGQGLRTVGVKVHFVQPLDLLCGNRREETKLFIVQLQTCTKCTQLFTCSTSFTADQIITSRRT